MRILGLIIMGAALIFQGALLDRTSKQRDRILDLCSQFEAICEAKDQQTKAVRTVAEAWKQRAIELEGLLIERTRPVRWTLL